MDYNSILLKNLPKFALFRCKGNSKQPATIQGFKNAQFGLNAELIIGQGYNVGLACTTSNLIVLDCDVDDTKDYNGVKALNKIETELGTLPLTLTQKTPRGGRHFIFSSKNILTPRGKIGKDIDVKYNGYIMIAPSVINGRQYEIIDGIDKNGDFIIAELPQAWLDYINKPFKGKNKKALNVTKSQAMPKVYGNINVDKMFRNCKFLQYCREWASCLSEPEWFSMISVLAQIKGSDELIHGLSAPYGRYSYEETQKKIDLARKFGRPQTCEYISATHGLCNGCKSAVQVKYEDNNND